MSEEARGEVYFKRIGWRDTWDVIRLSHSLLPRELCRKTHSLLALFVNLERRNHNLSFGLYCDRQLIGYMLVYFHDQSLFHKRDELIVHIDEYCVQAGFRGRGRDVITQMVYEIDLWQPQSGIEAIATGDALQHWLGIGRVVSKFGYETALKENDCMRGGHSMGRIRWSFIDGEAWRPDSPMKLPAPKRTVDINGRPCQLLQIRNRRQWLSLKSEYQRLQSVQDSKNLTAGFEYQWQWWRHFGIAEQLCVIAIIDEDKMDGDKLLAVYPLHKLAEPQPGDTALQWIAAGSAYPSAAWLEAPESEPACREALSQHLREQNLEVAGLFQQQPAVRQTVAELDLPSPPSSLFGLNRRQHDIHQSFQKHIRTL